MPDAPATFALRRHEACLRAPRVPERVSATFPAGDRSAFDPAVMHGRFEHVRVQVRGSVEALLPGPG